MNGWVSSLPLLFKNEQFRFNDLLNYYYKYNQTLHVLPFLSRKHFDILKTKINPFDSKLNYSMLLTYSYIYIFKISPENLKTEIKNNKYITSNTVCNTCSFTPTIYSDKKKNCSFNKHCLVLTTKAEIFWIIPSNVSTLEQMQKSYPSPISHLLRSQLIHFVILLSNWIYCAILLSGWPIFSFIPLLRIRRFNGLVETYDEIKSKDGTCKLKFITCWYTYIFDNSIYLRFMKESRLNSNIQINDLTMRDLCLFLKHTLISQNIFSKN